MRAELLVELLVAALAQEMDVQVAQRRQERVRVAQRVGAVRVAHLEQVAQRQLPAGQLAREQPGVVDALEDEVGAALDLRRDAVGVRTEGADDHTAVHRVRAEDAVRLREVPLAECDDVVGQRHVSGSWSRRAMPATGIGTQSGLLLSS